MDHVRFSRLRGPDGYKLEPADGGDKHFYARLCGPRILVAPGPRLPAIIISPGMFAAVGLGLAARYAISCGVSPGSLVVVVSEPARVGRTGEKVSPDRIVRAPIY